MVLKGNSMRDYGEHLVLLAAIIFSGLSLAHAGQDMSVQILDVRRQGAVTPERVPSATPPLIAAFPAPDGAPRGLAYDGQYLWLANSGDGNSLYGSKIYKVDPDSGTVVATYAGPSGYSCGLAWDGEFLWYSSYITGVILQLDVATMTVTKSFAAPTTHPFDLAWDGTYLYAVRGNEAYISVIDTSSGLEVDSIAATYASPNVRPFGLEFFSRNAPQLLTSDGNYGSNFVNAWNFYTAAWVDQWASEPAVYPCGLAHDPVTERLWVSCYERDSVYIYDVSQVGALECGTVPVDPAWLEVFPNPFSKLTNVSFRIGHSAERIDLRIYDVGGRLVKSFYPVSSIQDPESVVRWDGTDDAGNVLPAGVYFLQIPPVRSGVKLLKLPR